MTDTPQMPAILTDAEITEALRPHYQPEALAALQATPSLMADFRAVALAQAAKSVREALELAAAACLGEAVDVADESDVHYNLATRHCADAIHALAAEIPPPQKAGSD